MPKTVKEKPKTSPKKEVVASKTTKTPKKAKLVVKQSADKKSKGGKPAPLKKELDSAKAKSCGLTMTKYRLLSCMPSDKPVGYGHFRDKTGYYSNLTAELRKGKEGSLTETGHIKEVQKGDDKPLFQITAKGIKTLSKATAA